MSKKLFFMALFSVMSSVVMAVDVMGPNQILLPESYPVYTDGVNVLNHPYPGYYEVLLPTSNLYKGAQGCYIACYSHQKEQAIYGVGNDIYVLGQVRVAGKYNNRVCEPTNFAGKDISADATFKTICSAQVKACAAAQCWAGGDTGGWFGIQEQSMVPAVPSTP